MSDVNNDLLGNIFGGTAEEIIAADKAPSGFSKIEKSEVLTMKIVMAKQVDSGSSASKDFVIEMETEDGAKAYWKAGWYIGADGTIKDSKGNVKFQAIGLAKKNFLITGSESLPVLEPAMITEQEWTDGKPKDVTVQRNICKAMIGKFIKVQVVRVKSNRQVDSGKLDEKGYRIFVDGPEAKFTNEVKSFFDAATGQSPGEKKAAAPATLINDAIEYCEKHPILDKFKAVDAVAASAATASAPAGQPAVAGFGA